MIFVYFQLESLIIISFIQCKHYEYEHKDKQLVIDLWYMIKVYAWEEKISGKLLHFGKSSMEKFPRVNYADYNHPNVPVY